MCFKTKINFLFIKFIHHYDHFFVAVIYRLHYLSKNWNSGFSITPSNFCQSFLLVINKFSESCFYMAKHMLWKKYLYTLIKLVKICVYCCFWCRKSTREFQTSDSKTSRNANFLCSLTFIIGGRLKFSARRYSGILLKLKCHLWVFSKRLWKDKDSVVQNSQRHCLTLKNNVKTYVKYRKYIFGYSFFYGTTFNCKTEKWPFLVSICK